MRPSKSIGRGRRGPFPAGEFRRAGVAAALVAGLVVAVGFSLPAQAQWIGAPGGSSDAGASDGASSSAPATPAPAATAPAATAPAASAAEPLPNPVTGSAAPDAGFSAAPGVMPGAMPDAGLPAMGAPGGFSPGMGMMPTPTRPAGPSPEDIAVCQTQVTKLRTDLETRNGALRKAADRKRPPTELCPLFRNFVSSQQKFYDYLTANKTKCGVPGEAINDLKSNLTQVASIRDKVCEVAAAGPPPGAGGPPPQGAISQGLGLTSGLPTTSPKGGVFDTLGGDALR